MNPRAYAALPGSSPQLSTEGRSFLTKMLAGLVSSGNSRKNLLLAFQEASAHSWQSSSLSTWRHKTPLSVSISLCFLSLCQFLTICPCETQLSSTPQVPRPSFFDLEAELAAVKSLLNAAFPLERSLSRYGKCLTFSLLHHDLETKDTAKF